ncbi:MAG TPA: amidase [Gemmataceae bacterium]|nr:amidase [Gemmataceae bacterium]
METLNSLSNPWNVPLSVPNRRQLFGILASLGVGSTVFQRALATQAEQAGVVTPEMIQQAEWIAGLKLTDDERKTLAGSFTKTVRDFEALRAVALPNHVPPALHFNPAPGQQPFAGPRGHVEPTTDAAPRKPDKDDELAFLPLTSLAALVRKRELSSVTLTKLYLERLKKYDPLLLCVVSLTEELALKQAEQADKEIAAGRYRGYLHGIPWGAKDLIAYPGYKTTWGAGPFKDRTLDVKATVARRLEEAGAVLAAKTTLGALAMGDRWFGGKTLNPWNPKQGSSGSSAGSASAVAAGLIGFALGSETRGSIVSPCSRCGATGLRPTFGRVSRHGCMTLAWSMDKIGPIARSVEDCALVFGAIHGADGLDASAVDRSFTWPSSRNLRDLHVGYFDTIGDKEREDLKLLKGLGVRLVPVKLPNNLPVSALDLILDVEAAAAFDDLARQGVKEGIGTWPRVFQRANFIPAVEYVRAQRVRTLLMQEMDRLMSEVDLYVGGNDLQITNLTGHPTVVLPNGFRKESALEVPTAITFTGRLFGESELLAVAHAYQLATDRHLKRPPMDKVTKENLLEPKP